MLYNSYCTDSIKKGYEKNIVSKTRNMARHGLGGFKPPQTKI